MNEPGYCTIVSIESIAVMKRVLSGLSTYLDKGGLCSSGSRIFMLLFLPIFANIIFLLVSLVLVMYTQSLYLLLRNSGYAFRIEQHSFPSAFSAQVKVAVDRHDLSVSERVCMT